MKILLLVLTTICLGLGALLAQDAVEKKVSKPETSAKSAEPKNVTPDEVEQLMKSDPKPLIVDVRTPQEFANGHIAGAKNIDINDPDFAKKIGALNAKSPVIVHCAAGRRGAKALPTLSQHKFPAIYHMNGGLNAWKAAGKPVEAGGSSQ